MTPSGDPKRLTRCILLAALFGFFYRGYWIYSIQDHANNGDMGPFWDFIHGVGPAPFQYRIGVLRIAGWLYIHLHWPLRYGYSLLDLLGSTIAVFLGYALLCRRTLFRQSSLTAQWFASAAYVTLILYFLSWQDFYKKPETESTAALVMLLLWLWSPQEQGGPRFPGWLTSALILLVTLAQSLVRADVAFSIGLGAMAAAWLNKRGSLSLPRAPAIASAAAATILAVATQAVLMKLVYPSARAYDSPVFMLPHDIWRPNDLLCFLCFTLPSAWTLCELRRSRFFGDAAGLAFALGAIPYAVLWIVLGRIEEVRIFLPFAVALAPLTVQLLLLRISADTKAA